MNPESNLHTIFHDDPVEQFQSWYEDARQNEINDPDAMSLATIGADGAPNLRMVLCKSFDANGFRFFTNTESAKGQEIAASPDVALCFHWKSLQRQVRIKGIATKLPDADDDAYFHERHRESQIAAWASAQSRPLENMLQLARNVYAMQEKFKSRPVIRPPYWGGYNVEAHTIEFWLQRQHRLHERMLYTRADDGSWLQQGLYP